MINNNLHLYCSGYIKRILHGRAEIGNFSSSVEEYFTSEGRERVNIFQHEETCENNMLSSRVKISRFRAKAHLQLVFHWCLYN